MFVKGKATKYTHSHSIYAKQNTNEFLIHIFTYKQIQNIHWTKDLNWMTNTWASLKLSALSDCQTCSANYQSAGEVENVPPLGGVHIKLKLKEEHISGGHIVHWKTNRHIGKENTKREIWKYAHMYVKWTCA